MLISTKMYFKLKYPVYRINSIIFKTSSGGSNLQNAKIILGVFTNKCAVQVSFIFYFYIEIVYKDILDIKLHDIYSPFLCSFFSFHKKQQNIPFSFNLIS